MSMCLLKEDSQAKVLPTSDPPKPTKKIMRPNAFSNLSLCKANAHARFPLQIRLRYLVMQVTRAKVTKRWVLGGVAYNYTDTCILLLPTTKAGTLSPKERVATCPCTPASQSPELFRMWHVADASAHVPKPPNSRESRAHALQWLSMFEVKEKKPNGHF